VALAKPYFLKEDRRKAWGLLVLLVVLLLGQTQFNVLFNQQSGEFASALAAKDAERFWLSIAKCAGLLVFAMPLFAFYYFSRDTLANQWRRWMTRRFLDRYFRGRAFYKLTSNATVDNPDQRIAEDIDTFTARSLFFLLIVVGQVLQLVAFSGVLWSISVPLFVFVLVYAVAGSLVATLVFGRPLIGLNFLQIRREADFRFSLMRIRDNAESIALYGGNDREMLGVKQRLELAFQNCKALIRCQLGLNFFQNGYSYLTAILPSVILAPRVMSGELEIGRVVQAAGAFAAILGALTIMVDNLSSLSRFSAGIGRLDALNKALEEQAEGVPGVHAPAMGRESIVTVHGHGLALRRVTLRTPNQQRTLVRDLTLEVKPGEGLIIVGTSGGGKTSLLRAIAGLWDSGSGSIARPGSDEMMFLPQHPYMVLGSLRTQLVYPNQDQDTSDEELRRLMEMVNLTAAAERSGGMDAVLDWGKVLSLGEQQRIAVARVLMARPRYAILDEATSALGSANETRLYSHLMATSTTVVSVSHRSSLLRFHQHVLEIRGDGTWNLCDAQGYSVAI
jgi:putative ATP-binding cassette transporter